LSTLTTQMQSLQAHFTMLTVALIARLHLDRCQTPFPPARTGRRPPPYAAP
jgi:hypothetical protein